ncbi:MAG: hypothetical protein AAFO17_16340 [Pseudomonadota bacterium]
MAFSRHLQKRISANRVVSRIDAVNVMFQRRNCGSLLFALIGRVSHDEHKVANYILMPEPAYKGWFLQVNYGEICQS